MFQAENPGIKVTEVAKKGGEVRFACARLERAQSSFAAVQACMHVESAADCSALLHT